jgi:DNA-binding response OmpR family regulator
MSAKPKILLAEDEEALGIIIKESLETRGFDVSYCKDGNEAMHQYLTHKPDILVLDVMMPKKDGFTLVQEIRKMDPFIPIIFLTAKSRTEDVVEGFGYGGNDYLKKPFSMEELIVRIKSLLGTSELRKTKDPAHIGAYLFNPERQMLSFNGEEQVLTHRESELLLALVQNKNEVTDRKDILNTLWGSDDFFNGRSMDVFISKLRKRLAQDPAVQIINVRGYGYKLMC